MVLAAYLIWCAPGISNRLGVCDFNSSNSFIDSANLCLFNGDSMTSKYMGTIFHVSTNRVLCFSYVARIMKINLYWFGLVSQNFSIIDFSFRCTWIKRLIISAFWSKQINCLMNYVWCAKSLLYISTFLILIQFISIETKGSNKLIQIFCFVEFSIFIHEAQEVYHPFIFIGEEWFSYRVFDIIYWIYALDLFIS